MWERPGHVPLGVRSPQAVRGLRGERRARPGTEPPRSSPVHCRAPGHPPTTSAVRGQLPGQSRAGCEPARQPSEEALRAEGSL